MSGFINGYPQYPIGNPNQPIFSDMKLDRYNNLMQQPQSNNNSNMNFIIVESKEQAKNYIVQNGQTLWFRHSSQPEVYVKSVSSIGEPNFGAYILSPIVEQVMLTESDKIEYASKEDMLLLNQKVDSLNDIILQYENRLNQLINTNTRQNNYENDSSSKGGRPKSTHQTQKVGDNNA